MKKKPIKKGLPGRAYPDYVVRYAEANSIPFETAAAILDAEFESPESGIGGLGDLPNQVISNRNGKLIHDFESVLKKQNTLSDHEIEAWAWYKGYKKGGWAVIQAVAQKNGPDHYVRNGALFYDSSEHKKHVPFAIYTYGNIYDKILQLERDKEHIVSQFGEAQYRSQLSILEAARPKPLSFATPEKSERPILLPISKTAKTFVTQDGDTLNIAFTYWLKTLPRHKFLSVSAHEITEYYVMEKRISSRDYSEDEKEHLLKNVKIEGDALFSDFLFEGLHVDDRQKLDFEWNRRYNAYGNLQYNKVPIAFEMSKKFRGADFSFTPIQREGICFIEALGSGIVAYDVGVGKTITAIITLANSMNSGRCKRPLVVVPNQTYKKWVREIFGYTDDNGNTIEGVLSYTGTKFNDFYNLGSSSKKIDFSKKVEENSVTVMTYEGFNKIGFGDEAMKKHFSLLEDILVDPNNTGGSRDTEKEKQNYAELIGTANKDTVANIEDLGFDFIVIDEAHNFKNVFGYVPVDDDSSRRSFNIQSAQSARAIRAFFHCNYIQQEFGRNVMLLTATPFTNNPLEIYSMLSLVGWDTFKRYGFHNLTDFMATFINEQREYVNSYDGTIKQKPVVKAFNNRLILQKLIYNHINYKTGEEAGVVRPCKLNQPRMKVQTPEGVKFLPKQEQMPTYLAMNEMQDRNQAYINDYPNSTSDPFERMARIMQAMGYSLDNALSPYIFKENPEIPHNSTEFVENSPKIHYICECIGHVKAYHEAKGEECSGQVVYMNRGKEYFHMIKEYLEKKYGFKKKVRFDDNKYVNEVEILDSSVSQENREKIKEAFLANVCKVIIGTATIREGIDLQKNGTVVYNAYPDWNPTDQKQLEGRIWRQGNKYGWVRIVQPLVQNSMDVFVYQKLEEKTARVNDIWYRADRGNVLDVEAIDPEEVKFALYTNLQELAKIMSEKAVRSIRVEMGTLEDDIKVFQTIVNAIEQLNKYKQDCIAAIRKWKEQLIQFQQPDTLEYYRGAWGETPKGIMEEAEKAKGYVEEIEKVLIEPNNKAITSLSFRITSTIFVKRNVLNREQYTFEGFKNYMLVVGKAEDTTLPKHGLTLDSNFEEAIERAREKLKALAKNIEYFESPKYLNEAVEVIKKKREQMAVDGLSAEEAAENFARYNYLLDWKASDIDHKDCALPAPLDVPASMKGKERPNPTKMGKGGGGIESLHDKRAGGNSLELAKAKAKAIKIKQLQILIRLKSGIK